MTYEKARIKLLDKNTGQVLKEVDPFTSSDAVDYDGNTTVKDRLTEIILYNNNNDTEIQKLKAQDAIFSSNIQSINSKDFTQDSDISTLKQSVVVINNSISSLEDYNDEQDNAVELLKNSVYSKTDSDNRYYTKTQSDTNYYTKAQSDTNYYNKTQADTRYYTKTQSDTITNALDAKITTVNNTTTTNLTNQIISKGNNYAVTTGTNTQYTVSISGVSAYADGLTIVVLPHTNCGDAPTIRINSLQYLQIKNLDGDLLSTDDLKANIPIILVRVGNYFFIRASKRAGGLYDTTPVITPGAGTLLTSGDTIVSHDELFQEVVRIVNYETVYYRTYGGYLYEFNLRRNLAKRVATGFYGNGPMKLWMDKYYIYGTNIYDLKFNKLASFATKSDADHIEDKEDNNDRVHTRNFSEKRPSNHFITDASDPTKLYFIEYRQFSPVQIYWSNPVYSGSYSDEFWGEKFYVRVNRVNADFSLSVVTDVSNLNTWDDSQACAIKGNYIYLTEIPQLGPNGATAYFTRVDMTNITSYVRKYPANVKERNASAWDQDSYYAWPIASQQADRLVEIQTEHVHSSNRSDTDQTYYYVYDVISDTQKYTFYSSNDDVDPIYAFGGSLTNNPQLWLSSGYLDGVDPSTEEFVQTNVGYSGNLTSKYRLVMQGKTAVTGTSPNYVYTYTNHLEIYKL